jgi:hypothetical protein
VAGVCCPSFNQQGKARLAPVGREVIFGSGTYTYGSLRPAGLSRWKCTLLASPSVGKTRKRSPSGWGFLESRVFMHPTT